jgi:hypothetical protein
LWSRGVVAGQHLCCDEMTRCRDRHSEPGKNLDRLRCCDYLRLDAGAREQNVDDHSVITDVGRRGRQSNGGQSAGCVLFDRGNQPVTAATIERTAASAAASSSTATATSASPVNRGSARAATANPPTRAHRWSRLSRSVASRRRAASTAFIRSSSEPTGRTSRGVSLRRTRPAEPPGSHFRLDVCVAGVGQETPEPLPLHSLADLVEIEGEPQPPSSRRGIHEHQLYRAGALIGAVGTMQVTMVGSLTPVSLGRGRRAARRRPPSARGGRACRRTRRALWIHGGGLLDQDSGGLAVDLDLRPEGGQPTAEGDT